MVYPALSPGGTITYVQARYLDPPAGRDKYDNPARSHATNPRVAWLHPLEPARRGVLVVSEGVADGLVAAQAGFPTVGVLGSQYPDRRVVDAIAATMERSPALRGATVVVCFDADPSGRAGADRLCALLADRGVPHRVGVPARRARPDRLGGRRPVGWATVLADPRLPTCRPLVADRRRRGAAAPTPGLGIGLPGPGERRRVRLGKTSPEQLSLFGADDERRDSAVGAGGGDDDDADDRHRRRPTTASGRS